MSPNQTDPPAMNVPGLWSMAMLSYALYTQQGVFIVLILAALIVGFFGIRNRLPFKFFYVLGKWFLVHKGYIPHGPQKPHFRPSPGQIEGTDSVTEEMKESPDTSAKRYKRHSV